MASPREIRRLAFQTLYQFDARTPDDISTIRSSLDEAPGFTHPERDKAFALARAAFEDHEQADTVMEALAPAWPVSRQAAVDRAILRLAHYEMTSGRVPPKVAVNEAVELAKAFSTKKSPAFINGLLDKVLKKIIAQTQEPSQGSSEPV